MPFTGSPTAAMASASTTSAEAVGSMSMGGGRTVSSTVSDSAFVIIGS
jgi:hypothetical protein